MVKLIFRVLSIGVSIPNTKLKAGTIIESIVAMTIVMISFGIALLIFLNINKRDNSFQKFKAQLLLNEFSEKAKKENILLADEHDEETIKIVQTVSEYPGHNDVKILLLEAYTLDGKKITDRKELILQK